MSACTSCCGDGELRGERLGLQGGEHAVPCIRCGGDGTEPACKRCGRDLTDDELADDTGRCENCEAIFMRSALARSILWARTKRAASGQ